MGGFAGTNSGTIQNCYALGDVNDAAGATTYVGGFLGNNAAATGVAVGLSYSIGAVKGSGTNVAAFVGIDSEPAGSITNSYWNTDPNGSIPGYYPSGDTGMTGMTKAAFKSGLPGGFSSMIWGQNSSINSGLPYLLVNPPS